METVNFIVSLWPIAAAVFILILTIGKILNRLDVVEDKVRQLYTLWNNHREK
jgi:hypothetical protein